MEEVIENMTFIGHYHFSAKDKSKFFYVIQALYNKTNEERHSNKGTLINIFVSDEIYGILSKKSIGEVLRVSIIPNHETGKIYYKVVI